MTREEVLTNARASVWDAIENYSKFKGDYKLGKLYKLDDEQPAMAQLRPAPADLPAVFVIPADISPRWIQNKRQFWPYRLQMVCFVGGWAFSFAEGFCVRLIDCLGLSKDSDGIPYTKRATGHYVKEFGPVQFLRTTLSEERGGPKATRVNIGITMRLHVDPLRE